MTDEVSIGGRTPRARLTRLGFTDADAATTALGALGDVSATFVEALARAADPDLAAASLASLAARFSRGELLARLDDDAGLLERLVAVCGASQALGAFLARHPEAADGLATARFDPRPMGATDVRKALVGASDKDSLRVAYSTQLLLVAARDLTDHATLRESAAELADLAGETLHAALGLAGRRHPDAASSCRLAVIAMGKCGGRELNYVSDVDVIFCHEPADSSDESDALRGATRLASELMHICSDHTAEGTIWEVDAALRPEGRSGPLVRTLSSHVTYYQRWAKTWEFQALLKARPVAGDEELGRAYVDALSPMVWEASTRTNFVDDVRAMRRRVVEQIPVGQVDRELKLGPGGLRDVEFAVQLLQLVHGRGDERLRGGSTLGALDSLIEHGYVGRADGGQMGDAYAFLRTLEHRIQLYHLRRTHLVPDDPTDLRRLGRSMGYRVNPEDDLDKDLRAQRREVGRLHQKLFYRPLLQAVAALPRDGLRLTPEAAKQRLVALGYADPTGALAHISALASGVSRRADMLRSLLPAMLSWFAEGPDPDAGLLAFRKISEGLGSTHWYLRKLRDEAAGAEQLARVVASSRYVTDLLLRAPESVAILGDDDELSPRSRAALVAEAQAAASRHDHPMAAVRAVRRIRRRELSRVGIADVLDRLDIVDVGHALTDIAVATLSGALTAATAAVEDELGTALPTRMTIVLMGRLGGHEVGYGSDADVMFVHDPLPGAEDKEATDAAAAVAQHLRRSLAAPGDDPALSVDADLRPEGRQGPLVRSLASYTAYYARWSAVWEAQALLRADPAVGDESLCRDFATLIDPLRWPPAGVAAADVTEIRRIKARVDAERLPRGANPATHLKLGRGGLADVEWTVQLLQMRHARVVPGLRTTETLAALSAARDADLLATEDAVALEAAWRLVSRIRNAIMLMRARPAESLVEHTRDRNGVAHLMGYGADQSERMVDDYLRATRQARGVFERIFWG